MKAKCPLCNYEWNSTGVLFYLTCPRCRKMRKREVFLRSDNDSSKEKGKKEKKD